MEQLRVPPPGGVPPAKLFDFKVLRFSVFVKYSFQMVYR